MALLAMDQVLDYYMKSGDWRSLLIGSKRPDSDVRQFTTDFEKGAEEVLCRLAAKVAPSLTASDDKGGLHSQKVYFCSTFFSLSLFLLYMFAPLFFSLFLLYYCRM